MTLEGRHEEVGAQGVDALVVLVDLAVRQDHLLPRRVQGGDLLPQHQLDVVGRVPVLAVDVEHLGLGTGKHVLSQHGPVVGQLRLVGDHHDGAAGIPGPDGLGGAEGRPARAQDHIPAVGGVGIGDGLRLDGHEVLAAHAAGGTDGERRVKHGAADQALDQPGARDGLQGLLLLHEAAEAVAEVVGVGQVGPVGLQPHPKALHDLHVQLFQPLRQVGHRLAAPAVAAEGRRVLAAVDRRIHVDGQVPDGVQSLLEDGGRAQQNAVGPGDLAQDLRLVGGDHVVQLHLKVAAGFQALGDLLRQLGGVAVGTDVGDDHFFGLVGLDRAAPLLVLGVQVLQVAVQHGAVARADHDRLDLLPHAVEGVGHVGLLEGAQDVVEIVLRGPHVPLVVRHRTAEDAVVGVVGAEGVAGHQHAVLLNAGVDGIRPVEAGDGVEADGLVAQAQGIALPHHHGVEVPVDDVPQEGDGRGGADDLDVGIDVQQFFDAAGVVRLRVVHDDVLDVLHRRDLLHRLQIVVEELGLGGLKQCGLFAALQDVGVVGGAELGVHDDVEHPQVLVQNAHPVQAVVEFQGLHRKTPPIQFDCM